jgi:hypothetical protein
VLASLQQYSPRNLTSVSATNNLVLGFSDGGSLTIANAFDTSGNFTTNAIETILFSGGNSWNQTQIKAEVIKDQTLAVNGTAGNDLLKGSAVKEVLKGGLGDDQLEGGLGNDAYHYAKGDGKDVIVDTNGTDLLHFTSGVLPADLQVRSNGKDLLLTLSDGGSITVKDMFVTKANNTVDPKTAELITQLQDRWVSQSATLIKDHYGLTINHDITTLMGGVLKAAA